MKVRYLSDVKSVARYLDRVGAEPRSLRTAVVKEVSGQYWEDLATIKFDVADGKITTTDINYTPTEKEQADITAEWVGLEWPAIKAVKSIADTKNLPPMMEFAKEKDLFLFRDIRGLITMVQVRVEDREGGKTYIPFTYWDDDVWRNAEGDGKLPLFNAHLLRDQDRMAGTVFLHEGAKAARYVQWMVDQEDDEAKEAFALHPFNKELATGIHLGWIGGAINPQRTDFGLLKKNGVTRVYIVADNDAHGKEAVPKIAKQLHIPTFLIQFTDEFTGSFDLADPFPPKMFATSEGSKVYVGPGFRDLLHPATWATDVKLPQNGKGRPTTVLRDSFRGMWAYIEESDMFVCTEMPEIMRSEPILNKMLAPFSDASETTRLIVKAYSGRNARVCYRPDHDGLLVTHRGSSAINLHVPSTVRPRPGDPAPFLEFMDYLFPNPGERRHVLRWIATIISRPNVRMSYGLLLISERQGVGKTTLGASILGPLVGPWNVSFPSENDIMAQFNEWVAHKRLAVVSEIYSGQSWKAYHALKSVITDKDLTVNQKYMRQYQIDNWCHIIACSNSMRAMKMENDDRRWFYPEVTEVPWRRHKFDEFRKWLESGGLSIIRHWADNFGDYVSPAERAPMTDRKKEMIEGSRSEAQGEAVAVAEALFDRPMPTAIMMKDVIEWVRANVQGKVFDTDYELRRAMVEKGVHKWEKRVKISGRLQYMLVNDALMEEFEKTKNPDPEAPEDLTLLRSSVIRVQDLMGEAKM